MTKAKHIIKQALMLTDQQYAEMVMQFAHQWMQRYFGNEEVIISALHHSGWFWKWWVNQWDNRDEDFVQITGLEYAQFPLDKEVLKEVLSDYQIHHDVHRLRIVPNRMVVNEVGKLIKLEEQRIKQLKS